MTSSQLNSASSEQFYNFDERASQEKAMHIEQAQEIHKHNIETFGIKMTPKMRPKYQISELIREDLGDGWYANITDNNKQSEYTIFTMHGSPGDHREWAGLQTQLWRTCRWVNFILPGFDGEDQRRGSYSGSAQDISQMIIKILNKRKIYKMVFCGHSMGSIFASYFINVHPKYVYGYINVTGIVNVWYTGLMTFYRFTVGSYGFGKGPNKKALLRLLNKDEYREKHHARFIQDTRNVFFGTKVQFPDLQITQMCAYIKLFSSLPGGCSQFYTLNRRISFLRVLIFGKKDPLHAMQTTSEQIYSISRGKLNYHEIPENSKLLENIEFQKELTQTISSTHGVKLEASKLQQYFCFHFDDTGHNAHKRRPIQISKIIRVYLNVLGVIQKYRLANNSKM